jgi:hypothetical protein
LDPGAGFQIAGNFGNLRNAALIYLGQASLPEIEYA